MAKVKTKETPIDTDYYAVKKYNEESFLQLLKHFRPDLFVLGDLLDSTGVNYYIIFQVIRHLNNVAMGNKYGSVTIQVENGVVTFVRGEESTKLNEDLIRKRQSQN